MRRLFFLAALPACLLAVPVAAQAARTGLIPAPPASATATALSVADLLDVSTTGAQADTDTSSAQATVVELGGEPLLGLGGTQSGPGTSDGALLDTGSTLPAQVQVAPWEATASQSDTERSSRGSAAAARADVPEVLDVDVLESESQATHTDEKSTGEGSSNGVNLGLLEILRIVLFHSEVSSEGNGSSFLVGLNGTEIGSDEQLSGICSLVVAHPLLSVSCLDVAGGLGGGLAELAGIDSSLVPPVQLASAFSVGTSGGTGESVLGAVEEAAPVAAATETARAPEADAATEIAGGMLPRTGAGVALTALAAALAIALGLALRKVSGHGVGSA
ncbi:MAG: hypothetical protein ACRD0O_12190 [Acidimicrobiia bacterium]